MRRERRAPGLDALLLGALLLILGALSSWVGRTDASSDFDQQAPVRTILVDLSASSLRPRSAHGLGLNRALRRQARHAESAGEDLLLVTFARGARLRFGPGPATEFREMLRAGDHTWFDRPADDMASDLAAAASVAAARLSALGPRPAGRVVLIGDGTWTGVDPGPQLLDPALGSLEWLEPAAVDLIDVELVRVRVPEEVEPGVEVRVDVDLALLGEPPDDMRLEWRLFGRTTETFTRGTNREQKLAEGTVQVADVLGWQRHGERSHGSVALVLPPMGEGSARVEVRAVGGPGGRDAFPENDGGGGSWTVGDPLRVLVVAGSSEDPALSRRMAGWLVGRAFEGIEFIPTTAGALASTLELEPEITAVMTSGVELLALPVERLAAFIEGGGSWVRWAGWSRLDRSGRLASLSALKPAVEPRDPRDIIILIDGSGSMRGARWARAQHALASLLPSVPSRDRLQLRFFTQLLGSPRLRFTPGGEGARDRRKEALAELRDIDVPGGSTDISGSLDELVRELASRREGSDDRSSLIILLTDGVPTLTGAPAARVRESLVAAGHELVVIQAGDPGAAPTSTLKKLAGSAEAVVMAGELEGVLGILQEAVQGMRPILDAELVRTMGTPEDLLGGAVSRSAMALDLGSSLSIARAVPCRVADGATGLFDLVPADPAMGRSAFCAVAPRGMGMVVDMACPLLDGEGARWAPRLEASLDWLGPLLRAAGERARTGLSARAEERAATAGLEWVSSAMGPAGRVAVRGLPAGSLMQAGTVPAALAGPFPSGSSPIALELHPDPLEAQAWIARRPEVLDAVPRGAPLVLEVLGQRLNLSADGPEELRATTLTGRSMASWARNGAAGNGLPATSLPPGQGGPHPWAPWLALSGALLIFVGALGWTGDRAGRRRETGQAEA